MIQVIPSTKTTERSIFCAVISQKTQEKTFALAKNALLQAPVLMYSKILYQSLSCLLNGIYFYQSNQQVEIGKDCIPKV